MDEGYDTTNFDEYLRLVNICQDVAERASSKAIKAEAPSIIAKMRCLLDSEVRNEVDYVEAIADISVIRVCWQSGNPVGRRAFIPTPEDRDMAVNALQILSCAFEERKQVMNEYIQAFGFEGLDVYNELLSNISDHDRKALPFVNMCLQAWLNKLQDDVTGNLWENMSVLSFGDWLAEEMKGRSEQSYTGKSSYDLLMRTFGGITEAKGISFSPESIAKNLFCVQIRSEKLHPPSSVSSVSPVSTSKIVSTPSLTAASTTTNGKGPEKRIGKKQRIGAIFRNGLRASSGLQRGRKANKKADVQLQAAIDESMEGAIPDSALQQCRVATKKMEDLLFSSGGAERVIATLNLFKERPAVTEALQAGGKMQEDGNTLFSSREDRFNLMLVERIKDFLAMLKGKGWRKKHDQNAYNVIMASATGGKVTSEKFERYLAKRVGASYCQISRGRVLCSNMEDKDVKHWIRVTNKTSGAAIKDEHLLALSETLHSDDFCRIDKTDKTPVVIDN